jgi:hypothetical protein
MTTLPKLLPDAIDKAHRAAWALGDYDGNEETVGDYDPNATVEDYDPNEKSGGCPNCGRHRLCLCPNGKHRCEKCDWCPEDAEYAPVDKR